MIECDNRNCESVGTPEWIGKRKGKVVYTAPYGWFQGDVNIVGRGPSIEFDACSASCIGPAIDSQFRLAIEKERDL